MANAREIFDIVAAEAGVPDDDQDLLAKIESYWSFYSDKPDVVRFLYCKRGILRVIRAQLRSLVDTTTGLDRVVNSQQFKHVSEMLKEVQDEIKTLDPAPAAGRIRTRSLRGSLPGIEGEADSELTTERVYKRTHAPPIIFRP